jgi:ABC-type Fe3+-siderophore transport system permease subunit
VTSGRFVILAVGGLVIATGCLVLAAVVDSAAVAVVGALILVGVIAAKLAWSWRGRGREALMLFGGFVLVIGLAYVVSVLSS